MTAPILITGTAGFIGFHVARHLLTAGETVVGVDGFTPYYNIELKRDRHELLMHMPGFSAHEFMIEDHDRFLALLGETKPEIVIHLAAQAGVRYGLENPRAYIDSNIVGTFNVLEAGRANRPRHLLIASSSSVYGDGNNAPYEEQSESSRPLSLYAATKKSVEVIAHAYSHLHRLPTTAFRFFTVYGPWGRPDMAPSKFAKAIMAGEEIEVFGHGRMSRDFTYIDDLVAAVVGLVRRPPRAPGDPERTPETSPNAPFRVVNIGASQPVDLEDFISAFEQGLGRKARRKYLPMQSGDVRLTYADTRALHALIDLPPPTPLAEGISAYLRWYKDYYGDR